MGYLEINQEVLTEQSMKQLISLCPFGAIERKDGKLEIAASCKMCRLCVKNGPAGTVRFIEEPSAAGVDKNVWKGITVYAELDGDAIHPVTLELLGKAKELAKVTGHPVYAFCMGDSLGKLGKSLLEYGADKAFLYEDPRLAYFNVLTFANLCADFIEKINPSSVLVGATSQGRSLAPKVAARFKTGLTADCTVLEMKGNTDLVQIRPAFGGNIMAQIITPKSRPQFCTVRYKVFSAGERNLDNEGSLEFMKVEEQFFDDRIEVLKLHEKERETDISDAEMIIAVGRGVKSQVDLNLIHQLADCIGAQVACTRPLVENGWFDARKQIGLSGRTVKPKLIITVGISGAVQFLAGMKGSDCIIAINKDRKAAIFDVAHYGVVGDWYEILPALTEAIRRGGRP